MDLQISATASATIAVSITALFSGIFHRCSGWARRPAWPNKADQIGLALSMVGLLLIAISPARSATFLLAGRIIQGLFQLRGHHARDASTHEAYFGGQAPSQRRASWSIGSRAGIRPSRYSAASLLNDRVAMDLLDGSIHCRSAELVVAYRNPHKAEPRRQSESASTGIGLFAFVVAWWHLT